VNFFISEILFEQFGKVNPKVKKIGKECVLIKVHFPFRELKTAVKNIISLTLDSYLWANY